MAYIIQPKEGSTHRKKRRGCGLGSGLGKTAGRGHKGQRARSGQKRPYMGFEGGQMPIYRRVPKRGFYHKGESYAIVNLQQLNKLEEGATVNAALLAEKKIIKNENQKVKILGNGDLNKKLNVEVHKISASAQRKIEKSGGSVKLIEG